MNYYLKVNRNIDFTYKNLQNWMNVISEIEDSQMIIIADNADVVRNIVNFNHLYKNTTFISSEREDPDLKEIVPRITDNHWRNAGYAHLTTFLHAGKNSPGQPFWNIDADDTFFCVSTERLQNILKEAATIAHQKEYLAYSLDMNRTITRGVHWSFGITYTDNSIDWISKLKEACKSPEWESFRSVLDSPNVDWFFTWLDNCPDMHLGTFFVENLRFVHFSTDILRSSWFAGILHWSNGTLRLPLMKSLFCMDADQDEIKIAEDVDKIDIGIDDTESMLGMRRMGFRANEHASMVDIQNWLKKEWNNWEEIGKKLHSVQSKSFLSDS